MEQLLSIGVMSGPTVRPKAAVPMSGAGNLDFDTAMAEAPDKGLPLVPEVSAIEETAFDEVEISLAEADLQPDTAQTDTPSDLAIPLNALMALQFAAPMARTVDGGDGTSLQLDLDKVSGPAFQGMAMVDEAPPQGLGSSLQIAAADGPTQAEVTAVPIPLNASKAELTPATSQAAAVQASAGTPNMVALEPKATIAATEPLQGMDRAQAKESRMQKAPALPAMPDQGLGGGMPALSALPEVAPLPGADLAPPVVQARLATDTSHGVPQSAHLPAPQSLPRLAAPQVIGQILPQAAGRPDGPVEFILDPEDLGKLRFEISHRGDSVLVVLAAERQDTQAGLRRLAGELAQELRQAGYRDVSLSFADWGGTGQQAGERQSQASRPIFWQPEGDGSATAALERPGANPIIPGAVYRQQSGIFLRL